MDKSQPMDGEPVFAPNRRVIRASEMQAWNDGDAFIAAARTEADRILAEARAEGERLLAAARQEGERAGIAAITQRVADIVQRLNHLVQHSEYWLADLVVETVQRILGDMDKKEVTVGAAIATLRAFRHARRLVVRVPPSSVEWMERGIEESLEPALRALLVIQPDPRLAEGRCVVVTEFGTIEAGIAEQLGALRTGLRAQREEELGGV